ncbi:MAG TPA: V-type ATP synthase subunit D [Acholeplasmataceae bacterium]|nr:V-type ATP synthase subunit D [Acholeplasmataceae bacterium]
MQRGQINPTRMELRKLKNKLQTAIRGHKLLKDKQDELIHAFVSLVNETKDLREKVDGLFSDVLGVYTKMKQKTALVDIYEMLMIPSSQFDIKYSYKSIMTVEIPSIDVLVSDVATNKQTYSEIKAPIEIDEVEAKMNLVFKDLIGLAEKEQSIILMTEEIAKTRRRVNVIENILIPDLEANIKRITMKLEDTERSNTVRIMKSKEIVIDKMVKERQQRSDLEKED